MKKITLLACLSLFFCYSDAILAKTPKTITALKLPTVAPESPHPLTGTFDISSNYMFRGISQTSNLPAIQGGFTYTILKTGIYINLWGSNVNFKDIYGYTGTLEFDTSIGITNQIGKHFTYDLKGTRYNYPKAAPSFNEVIGNFIYDFITAQIAVTNNVFNTHHNGTYYNLGFKQPIPPRYIFCFNNMTISGGVGHWSLPRAGGLRSYNDYNLQLSKTIKNYVLSLLWTDTNGRSVDANSLKYSHIVGVVAVNF